MEAEGIVPLNNRIFDPKMANHSIDIYYYHMSPPSRATLLLIRALGLKHNIKIVDIPNKGQMTSEFLKINPLHTIPVINDGEFIVYDSHVIMKYLVNQYAKDDSLYPKDPKKEAVVDQRLYFEASYLFPRFIAYFMPTLFGGQPPNEEAHKKLEEAFQHMDNFLKNQNWFAGTNMTIADFSLFSPFSTVVACDVFDFTNYQNLWQWYQRAKSAMSGFGYDEIEQEGANAFGGYYKRKIKDLS
ncbi:glutathione S-transferase 1-1-like [Anoplophora glabripennis]|uniref:glutathione S-transferase 1-1-like n=1 Tax=Anoplophora glabripennis TaxID=217634 RepID=UPI00087500E6|nr:glutathione S-transferase 1-1-like [Anoplophora glabripennis]